LAARFAYVADQAVRFAALGGEDAAVAAIRRRSVGWLDPGIASAFERHGPTLLQEIATADVLRAVVEAEPQPWRQVPADRLDVVARAFADLVDLKSPFLHGHSTGVADLAAGAAHHLGFGDAERARLRHAALLHDLGRVGVPDGIWDKRGPLTSSDWERVRLHPYTTPSESCSARRCSRRWRNWPACITSAWTAPVITGRPAGRRYSWPRGCWRQPMPTNP